MEKLFSKDNVFLFDKITWMDMIEKRILLKFEGETVNINEYGRMKKKIKHGIKLDVQSIKLLKR
jgi:hypothetical protein